MTSGIEPNPTNDFPKNASGSPPSYRKVFSWYPALYILLTLYFLWSSFTDGGFLGIAFPLGCAFFATKICIEEARFHLKSIPANTYWLIFFTWPIALLAVLIWLKKWRSLFLVPLHLFFYFSTVFLAEFIANAISE